MRASIGKGAEQRGPRYDRGLRREGFELTLNSGGAGGWQALENRTLDSKREMDILAALDEMRSLNARHERLDPEAALAALRQQAETNEEALEAEDEAAIREYVLQRSRVKRVQVPDEGLPSWVLELSLVQCLRRVEMSSAWRPEEAAGGREEARKEGWGPMPEPGA